ASAAAYPLHSVFSPAAGTLHSRTLSNLAPGTYYFRVRSSTGTSVVESTEHAFAVCDDPSLPLELPVPSLAVYTTARVGSLVYLGGFFSSVAVPTGAGMAVDSISGAYTADQPRVDAALYAVAPDG